MSDYIPDRWVILKITGDDEDKKETVYKVLGAWFGGYFSGDSWRLNSGITSVVDNGPTLTFHGHSGSTYLCSKQVYGTHSMSCDVVQKMAEMGKARGRQVEVLSEEEAISLKWCSEVKKVAA